MTSNDGVKSEIGDILNFLSSIHKLLSNGTLTSEVGDICFPRQIFIPGVFFQGARSVNSISV